MKRIIPRKVLFTAILLAPLAAPAGELTYFDCMNPDGTMSYRVIPCSKGQQEVRRQKELGREEGGLRDRREPPVAGPGEPDAASGAMTAIQQDFAAAETDYRLEAYGEAAKLYRKTAEQGYAPAQFRMGVMYDIGLGVAQDYHEALSWYLKAAEQGNAKAQNNLGFMYSQGKGTAQDYVTAHMWFNIAGARGYEEGRKNREVVEAKMNPEQVAEAQRRAGEWMKAHP